MAAVWLYIFGWEHNNNILVAHIKVTVRYAGQRGQCLFKHINRNSIYKFSESDLRFENPIFLNTTIFF